jgi:MraZ protein
VTGERAVIYSGQDFSLKGEKGRFVLPSGFRKTVAQSSGGKMLCLDKHHRWNCLVGFGLSRESELEALLEREEDRAYDKGRDFDVDTRRHQLFGFARIPFDDSGRFVMPQHLVELGGLTEGVFFHGAGTFFTLWDPEELYRMGAEFENAQAACRSLVAENKGKKG